MKVIPEQVIQQQAYNEFSNKYCLKFHSPRLIIHSVPNGISMPLPPKEKSRVLDQLKKTGMVNGISDLIIHGIKGRCIMAECKNETGIQSDSQKEIESRINGLGGVYILFYSVEEFWTKINPHIPWLLGKE